MMSTNILPMIAPANHHKFVTEIEGESETEEDDCEDVEINDNAVTKLDKN